MNPQKHTVDYLKRLAKKIKKERSISHSLALDIIAKENGYSNWQHCQRSLKQASVVAENSLQIFSLEFTDWLKKNKNRSSPLGDLASDALRDKDWPSYSTLQQYLDHLQSKSASWPAIETMKKAWKTYKYYLKRKSLPTSNKPRNKSVFKAQGPDERKIMYIKNAIPITFSKRTSERFRPGDPAWISWNGTKAIPVTIIEVDDSHYTFRIERPRNKAGNQHYLFLDEVRSTPELACMNRVTS